MELKNTITVKEVTVTTKPHNGGWGQLFKVYKIVVLCLVILLIASSLLFSENIFGELNVYTQAGLIAMLFIALFRSGKRESVITPTEFIFYDDRLVIYREKIPCLKEQRKSWSTIKYDTIKYIKYNVALRRLTVRGDFHFLKYNICRVGH